MIRRYGHRLAMNATRSSRPRAAEARRRAGTQLTDSFSGSRRRSSAERLVLVSRVISTVEIALETEDRDEVTFEGGYTRITPRQGMADRFRRRATSPRWRSPPPLPTQLPALADCGAGSFSSGWIVAEPSIRPSRCTRRRSRGRRKPGGCHWVSHRHFTSRPSGRGYAGRNVRSCSTRCPRTHPGAHRRG
jgi:hypothetical protein